MAGHLSLGFLSSCASLPLGFVLGAPIAAALALWPRRKPISPFDASLVR